MAELINPFLGFKDPLQKKGHNPYRFNPFTVLRISKDEIDSESINDKVEDLKWKKSELNESVIANAQRYLEEPLQRLAFELLIPDKSAGKIEEDIHDE